MRRAMILLGALYFLLPAGPAWSQPDDLLPAGENLTLTRALALASEHNPTLAAFGEELRAKDATALQAGLLPNPELAIEVENFAGEDELEGLDGAETTIALAQLVELGGKRSKRRQVAGYDKDLAGWDYQARKLDLLAGTAKAFIQLLAAQQSLAQAGELARLSEQVFEAVAARVEAGKVPPVEQTRAQVELAAARTAAFRAGRDLEAARRRLAAFWGEERPAFARALGDLTAIAPLPAEEQFAAQLANNPDLARWGSELEQREASLALARSAAIPDLTLSLGVRNSQESDSNALVAGIELPLPLFDRNQGGIREARAILEKARAERRAAASEARAGLAEAWQNLAAAHAEASALRDEILPGAQSAFESTEFAYREGKFDFLQMLDAQRTLFEVRSQYLQALTSYHLARTEAKRLIGAPLHDLLETADK
ncbi:cytochrome c [Desulfuromonas versatilis]|uniref:Cytochrome c n=1 Tax=Desulfuromonas versatilis TaxID=2802975 RepID=A0ABM8HRW4_9BACT|nr:TolC family protein [Desulfuromonas versatilis]BCR03687.1 cytochrome c [Desulfuromonas versatilis]